MRRPDTGMHRFFTSPRRHTIRPRLEELEHRLAPAVSLLNHFDGLVSGGPPDTCGAAGPNSYVETVNSQVAIYNKSTNAVIASDTLTHFLWTTGGITPADASAALSDATMCYDEPIGRFVIVDLDLDRSNGGAQAPSQGDIAVSKSSDPTALDTANWTFFKIPTSEGTAWSDYPGNLGYNHDALVITWNMIGSSPPHTQVDALSQGSLASGGIVSISQFDQNGFNLRPVTMHDSAAGDPMWFVTEDSDHQSINLDRIDNILNSSTRSVHTFNIGVNSYINANHPLNPDGTTITSNSNGTKIMKAAERNNDIVACQQVGVGTTENDARWYEFNVSNINSPFLVQQGNVSAGNNTYLMMPAIDINAAGDIAMSYIRSGTDSSTDFMSVWITGRKASDAAGTMETPVEIRAGDSDNLDGREGDFSGINVDPGDGSFWVANEYTTNFSGATEVANFVMNGQNFFVVNSQLDVFGDQLGADFNDDVIVDENGRGGVYVTLNGEQVGFDPGQIHAILIELGGGSNIISVVSTPSDVVQTHIVSGGSDTVVLGAGGSTQNIHGDVNIENPLSFTSTIVDDAFDSGSRNITLRNSGANPTDSEGNSDPYGQIGGLLGNGNINYEYADTDNVTVDTGTGMNTIDVQATGGIGSTNLVTHAHAIINVGNNGSVAGILATLNIESPPDFNAITIDDSADTTARTVNLLNIGANSADSQGNSDAWGEISGLGVAPINYEYTDTSKVTLATGTGSNTIFVLATGGGGSTNLVTHADTTINVGNGGSVAGILNTLNIEGPGGHNNINIDDSADGTLRTVTLRNIGANPSDSQGNSDPWGQVSGLGSAIINYEYADTSDVTLRAGNVSGNVINVFATGINGPTNIQANAAATINVGDGTVAGILGALNLENTPAFNTIVINDSTDSHARTVTLHNIGANPSDSQGNSDPWGQVSGLAPANVNYELTDTSSMTLRGSNAASTYNMQNTAISTTVVGGGGNDTFNLGSGNSLGSIVSPLTINGGGGTNTLNANDSSSPAGQSYSISPTQLAGTDFATFTYASLHALNVTASSNDTLTILAPVPTALVTFHGGSGTNTLVGPNATATWAISGANSGKVGNVTFDHFQNLVGGSSSDTFNFTTTTASLSGTLNGGAGSNKISYATLGSSFPVDVTLTSNTTGMAPLLVNPFRNISTVAGSTDTANTLTAPNTVNLWALSGANTGKVNTFSFSGMPHLVGGTNVDTFKLGSISATALSLNGGGAPMNQGDWLNYASFSSNTAVTVNLATGSATNVNGGAAGAITGIQNVAGTSTGTNNLTGNSQGNILIGGTGLNTIVVGSGNSLVIAGGGTGHGSITGGSGEDILIAGHVTFNAGTTAGQNSLMAILAELQSSDTFADKVYDIIHGTNSSDPSPHGHDLNGSNKLTWGVSGATVGGSGGAYTLSGDTSASSNSDWFFSNSSSTVTDFGDDGVQDEHNNNAIGGF